jgi:acetyl esterase/lipase
MRRFLSYCANKNLTAQIGKYLRVYIGTCFAVLLFLFSCSGLSFAKEFAPDVSIVYKKINTGELKLHIFYPLKHGKSDRRPAIIFFHGGGWVRGSASQFFPQSRYFALKGMVGIAAEYRTKKKHGTSPRESVKDGKSAIRWIRSHAADIGIDPHKVAVGGGSAGGHIALAAATVTGFDEQGEDKDTSAKPNVLVLFNPILDTGPEGYGYDKVKDYWRDISPIHNLNKNVPPMIIFLGTRDRIVPVSTAERLKKILSDFNVTCELILYPNQEHAFFNYSRKNKYFYETMKEAERFLGSLGYLDKTS